jgi:type II secretory pathway predicted ATPase ExeA
MLDRPDDERIAHIQKPIWIGHPRAKALLDRLEALLIHPKTHRMPNLLIVGESNSGKTMLVKQFQRLHKPSDNPEGEAATVPVLYIQAPPVPDEGRFYGAILEQLFVPYGVADRVDKKQAQAIRVMKGVGLRVLIIDEIQHILAGALNRQRVFLNVIKYLSNELQIPIVGVGIPDAFRAIQTDLQLANRFDHEVLRAWGNDIEFRRFLATLERIIPLRNPSGLIEESLANRIYAMTDGLIGEVTNLLTEAALVAIKSGREKIDKGVLDQTKWTAPAERRRAPEVY